MSEQRIDAEALKAAVAIEDVIGARVVLKKAGAGELSGLCPFHKERTPSFTVTPGRGLYHCFGCGKSGDVFAFVQESEGVGFAEAVERVAQIAGFAPTAGGVGSVSRRPSQRPRQEITAVFEYLDEDGALLYEVCRMEPGRDGRKKDFLQRRRHPIDGAWVWGVNAGEYRKRSNGDWYPVKGEAQDGDDELPAARQVLYNLPDVIQSDVVYITEGEKDAGTLTTWGYVATTNSGGAAKGWAKEYTDALAGKGVVIVPDNDEPGVKRAKAIEAALKGIAKWSVTVWIPEGKDVTEYAELGHTAEEFAELVETTRQTVITRALEERGLLSPVEILDTIEGGANVFLDPSKRKPGISSGFSRLDEMTVGFRPGELIILAARPAMGKTALAMNIAENVASRTGPVAVFSLEMGRDQLLTRMVCSRARVDQTKYKAGFLNREERMAVQRALNEICRMPLGIDDGALADLESLHKKLVAYKKRAGGLSAVLVDYLQLMSPSKRRASGENRTQEVSALSRGLKLMAREMGCPFFVLSQLSRSTESRPGDHRPLLSDLRESGSIEQDADMVMFLFREEYYKPNDIDLRGKAELIMAKQRNGPVGTIPLTFLKHATRFESMEIDLGGRGAA